MYHGRDDKWTEFYFVIHSALVYLKNFFWDETIQFLSCTIFALSGVTRLPRVKRRRRKSWGKGKCMTKQMKLNLANCYQKNVYRKENTNFINNGSQKVVIVVSIFLPLTRGTASVKWGGREGEDRGFLTSFPRASVGYEIQTELVIIISFPTSASGIIEMWKTPQNIDKSSQLLTY